MNWKRWKIGLLISGITGICSGILVFEVVDKITWTQFGEVIIFNLAKDIMLYLTKHPIDQVNDTTFFTKERPVYKLTNT